ncbi:c-type cytochrome [Pseudomonas saliphila]|uniref:c-type cytochrome n=1 Tax=Pseudomonas saliphila TaxID=2586906 RepID=UPI00123A7128|nr:cytochrome c [Pseudomonas saliphila]
MPAVPIFKLFVPVALSLALVGCADEVDPDSPEGKRQALFKQMLHHSEPMGGMFSDRLAYDGEAFAEHARQLDALSDAPWEHFPEPGESTQPTDALPEIWSEPLAFSLRIDDFQNASAMLAAAVKDGAEDPEAVRDPLRAVQQSCKSCHDDFRR